MKPAAPEIAGNGVSSSADWSEAIKRTWAQGTAYTLELARVMSAARSHLPYGQWAALWQSGRMPFSKRKADMLVVIGNGLVWMDAQTFARLPRGWSVLYHLAHLDRRTLEKLVADGAVHPELRLREARELVARLKGKRTTAQAKRSHVRERVQKFAEFVDSTLNQWTPQERDWARAQLIQLIGQMETGSKPVRDILPMAVALISDSRVFVRHTPRHFL